MKKRPRIPIKVLLDPANLARLDLYCRRADQPRAAVVRAMLLAALARVDAEAKQ